MKKTKKKAHKKATRKTARKAAKRVTKRTAKKHTQTIKVEAIAQSIATMSELGAELQIPDHFVYCLRTCDENRQGYGGFQWPERGPIECRDWDPRAICGYGLHGLLKGEGGHNYLNWEKNAIWMVVAVDPATVVDIDRKVKFPRGIVVYSGDRETATALVKQRHPEAAVVGSTATAGDSGTATAGVRGTATAGEKGTATAGYSGTATAGYSGTATAGDYGTATAGVRGTATAGEKGTIQIKWWDEANKRYRVAIGYIGESELLPNTKYKWDNGAGKFVEVTA